MRGVIELKWKAILLLILYRRVHILDQVKIGELQIWTSMLTLVIVFLFFFFCLNQNTDKKIFYLRTGISFFLFYFVTSKSKKTLNAFCFLSLRIKS